MEKTGFGVPVRLWRQVVLGLGVALGLAIAYVYGGGISFVGAENFSVIDSYAFSIALLVGMLVPVGYFLRTRDFTEFLAVALTVLWALYSGFQDVLVYLVSPEIQLPKVLPWLNDSTVGMLAGVLGFGSVTRTALLVTVFASFAGLLFLVKTLEELEARFLGLEI